MAASIRCLTNNLQQDFAELTRENQSLKEQNDAKRKIISQMVSRIQDLETEIREVEMQNYRLQKRIKLIDEHKANTERSRRETSLMLEELYCTVMNRFEKLQHENYKTKRELKELAKELSCNANVSKSNTSTPSLNVVEYEGIVKDYEKASDNFLRILAGYQTQMEDMKKYICQGNCSVPTQACETVTSESCKTSPVLPPQQQQRRVFDAPQIVCDAPYADAELEACLRRPPRELLQGKGEKEKCAVNLDAISNVSTRGSLAPPPSTIKATPPPPTARQPVFSASNSFSDSSVLCNQIAHPTSTAACSVSPRNSSNHNSTNHNSTLNNSTLNSTTSSQFKTALDHSHPRTLSPTQFQSAAQTIYNSLDIEKILDETGACRVSFARQNATEERAPAPESCSVQRADQCHQTPKQAVLAIKQEEESYSEDNYDVEAEEKQLQKQLESDDGARFKCNACKMAGSGVKPSALAQNCSCKWKSDGGDRDKDQSGPSDSTLDTFAIAEAPLGMNRSLLMIKNEPLTCTKKVLVRQDEFDEDDTEDDLDLLEDMEEEDNLRMQRSATPEPSPRRIMNVSPGVVSFNKLASRSSSPGYKTAQCQRGFSPPPAQNTLIDKFDTVKKFVGDLVKTIWSPSKVNLAQPSLPDVKLSGTPMRKTR